MAMVVEGLSWSLGEQLPHVDVRDSEVIYTHATSPSSQL
jgi:hypothetical protein